MQHGGRRKGAGRKRRLSLARREEIKREDPAGMGAWAGGKLMARDRELKKRRAFDKAKRGGGEKMKVADKDPDVAEKFKVADDESLIRYARPLHSEMQKLGAERDRLPNRPSGAAWSRLNPKTTQYRAYRGTIGRPPRGWGKQIKKELAK